MAYYKAVVYDSGRKAHRVLDAPDLLAPELIPLMELLSDDPTNVLTIKDGKLFMSCCCNNGGGGGGGGGGSIDVTTLIASNDPLLYLTGANIASSAGLTFDTNTGKLVLTGVGGKEVSSAVIPTVVKTLDAVDLVENPANHPAGYYIRVMATLTDGTKPELFAPLVRVVDVYHAGQGIDVTNNVVSLKAKAGGHIFVDAAGAYVDVAGLVSTDLNNGVTIGTDGKLYVDATTMGGGGGAGGSFDPANPADIAKLVSTTLGNALTVSVDGRLYVAPTLTGGVSTDMGNVLTNGSDGKPFYTGKVGNTDLGTI